MPGEALAHLLAEGLLRSGRLRPSPQVLVVDVQTLGLHALGPLDEGLQVPDSLSPLGPLGAFAAQGHAEAPLEGERLQRERGLSMLEACHLTTEQVEQA